MRIRSVLGKSIHLHHQPRKNKDGIVDNYSLATCYQKDGKNMKDIILRIGPLSKEQAENYRAYLKALNAGTPFKNLVDIDSLIYKEDKNYWDVLILDALWKDIGLNKVIDSSIKNNQHLSTENIAKILTFNRILEPTTKIRTIPWLQKTMLPKIMGIDEAHYKKTKIFDELTKIHKHKSKLEDFCTTFAGKFKDDVQVYYFDGSTSWFEGTHCDLAQYTKEKTRGYYPQVVGLMLVTDKRGFPIAWEIVPGKEKDQTAFNRFVDRIHKTFKLDQVTYCFDRGVASENNFSLVKENNSKFISGIKDNQIKDVFDLRKFEKVRAKILSYTQLPCTEQRRMLPIDGFYSSDKKIFYKDLGIVSGKRYIVSFNIDIYEVEKKEREKKVQDTLFDIHELNKLQILAKKDREYKSIENHLTDILKKHKTTLFFDYKLIPSVSKHGAQSYKIEIDYFKEKVRESSQTDGLMVYITDHIEEHRPGHFKVLAYDIIKHYRDKYIIEKAFREFKSFLDLRPFHVWTDDHVKAHYDIGVIAYFINQYIYHQLSIFGANLSDYLKKVEKTFPKEATIIRDFLIEKKLPVSAYSTAGHTKELINKVASEKKLSDKFFEKFEQDYPFTSINDFFQALKNAAPAIQLSAPDGVEIYKSKKPDTFLKNALKKLKLNHLIPSTFHTSLGISL